VAGASSGVAHAEEQKNARAKLIAETKAFAKKLDQIRTGQLN
jgi:hypothetical protein